MDHPRVDSAPPPSADAPQLLPVRDDRRQDISPALAPKETPDSLIPSFTYHIYADVVHGYAQDNARAPTTHGLVLPMFSPAAQQPTKRAEL
jgi:hypothetical protein